MEQLRYRSRVVDDQIRERLETSGAVVIEGPKACGKTATARQFAASEAILDADPDAVRLAKIDPRLLLEGRKPRLIDEWQLEPAIWNAVRHAVDESAERGQFILAGSATPNADARRHSGAGRMSKIRMRPMSLWETGNSSGDVSLATLAEDQTPEGHSTMEIADYAEAITRGGWPETVTITASQAEQFVLDYVAFAVEHPIIIEQSKRHDPRRFERFLRAYAQATSQPMPLSRIISRVVGHDSPTTGRQSSPTWHTADAYRDAAAQAMLIEDLPAWSPELRSRTRLAELTKRHLADPSLSAALLGADRHRLLTDPNTLGFLFESLATRDLRVYAEANEARVFHYRERDGHLEADLIVEWRNGDWIGIEVKLGDAAVDEAASNLLKLAERRIARKPASLVVLTGGKYAYRREDGVHVVPLGSMRP